MVFIVDSIVCLYVVWFMWLLADTWYQSKVKSKKDFLRWGTYRKARNERNTKRQEIEKKVYKRVGLQWVCLLS